LRLFSITGKEGGLFSNSKKRKLRQAMEIDQQLAEEHERSKKYTGPVGSNPWGAIANDWSGAKRSQNDFAEDLQLLASQLQGRTIRPSSDLSSRLQPKRTLRRDWDAPAEVVDDFEAVAEDLDHNPRSRKRSRLIIRSGSSSPPAQTLKVSEVIEDDESAWTTKSKLPKMQMYADSVENKQVFKK
jgi:hypothetical protein